MGKTNITAPVNKIISFSAVDGIGNRTAIFLQGCNQDCWYCHNPETIHHCTACGACVEACPVGALELVEEDEGSGSGKTAGVSRAEIPMRGRGMYSAQVSGPDDGAVRRSGNVGGACPVETAGAKTVKRENAAAQETKAGRRRFVTYDPAKCCNCDTCIKTCRENASPKIRNMTAGEVMEEILPYFPFINGITTSGGECTMHLDFLTELYGLVKREGKTTYADTNGQIPLWDREDFLQVTDKTMIDLKAGSEEDHRKLTGMGLHNPVENIRRMAEMGKLYEIRTVVVPGVVDNRRTVELGSSLIAAYPEVQYKLIKFRHYGVRKEYQDIREPSDEEMEALRELAKENGVKEIIIT